MVIEGYGTSITVLTLVRDPFHTPAAAYISSDVWCRCHLGVTHVITGCVLGMRSDAGLM